MGVDSIIGKIQGFIKVVKAAKYSEVEKGELLAGLSKAKKLANKRGKSFFGLGKSYSSKASKLLDKIKAKHGQLAKVELKNSPAVKLQMGAKEVWSEGTMAITSAKKVPIGKTAKLENHVTHRIDGINIDFTEVAMGKGAKPIKLWVQRGSEKVMGNTIYTYDSAMTGKHPHCKIVFDTQTGKIQVFDSSTNGTWVNGKKIHNNNKDFLVKDQKGLLVLRAGKTHIRISLPTTGSSVKPSVPHSFKGVTAKKPSAGKTINPNHHGINDDHAIMIPVEKIVAYEEAMKTTAFINEGKLLPLFKKTVKIDDVNVALKVNGGIQIAITPKNPVVSGSLSVVFPEGTPVGQMTAVIDMLQRNVKPFHIVSSHPTFKVKVVFKSPEKWSQMVEMYGMTKYYLEDGVVSFSNLSGQSTAMMSAWGRRGQGIIGECSSSIGAVPQELEIALPWNGDLKGLHKTYKNAVLKTKQAIGEDLKGADAFIKSSMQDIFK